MFFLSCFSTKLDALHILFLQAPDRKVSKKIMEVVFESQAQIG
jgi:hypothetical protein